MKNSQQQTSIMNSGTGNTANTSINNTRDQVASNVKGNNNNNNSNVLTGNNGRDSYKDSTKGTISFSKIPNSAEISAIK